MASVSQSISCHCRNNPRLPKSNEPWAEGYEGAKKTVTFGNSRLLQVTDNIQL